MSSIKRSQPNANAGPPSTQPNAGASSLAVGFVVCLVVQPICDRLIKPMLTSEERMLLDSLALPALQQSGNKGAGDDGPTEKTPLRQSS